MSDAKPSDLGAMHSACAPASYPSDDRKSESNATPPEVRSHGNSVRTGTNNRNIQHNLRERPFEVVAFFDSGRQNAWTGA
jgi:hypothetical protein